MSDAPPRILVVGSANVDMIVHSERLPRPGETVVGGVFHTAGGGKGANQAIAARRLGAEVVLVARVGADSSGQLTRTAFQSEGLDQSGIVVDPDAATGVALILVDRAGQNMISVASGANSRLSPDDVERARRAFANARILITQLEIPLETTLEALVLARANGLTTILNPAPARTIPDRAIELADWLTPNEQEAAALTGLAVDDLDSAMTAGHQLVERGAAHVVVTLGPRGAVLVTPTESAIIPAIPVEAVDTTAAGDAFTAGLAVSLARDWSISDALSYANAAGALAATRPGAQPSLPSDSEVRALLARHQSSTGSR